MNTTAANINSSSKHACSHRFQFNFNVEHLTGVSSTRSYRLKLIQGDFEHAGPVAKPAVLKSSSSSAPIYALHNYTLTAEATLIRSEGRSRRFEHPHGTLAVLRLYQVEQAQTVAGKTTAESEMLIGRQHFELAQYATLEPKSFRVCFDLAHHVRISGFLTSVEVCGFGGSEKCHAKTKKSEQERELAEEALKRKVKRLEELLRAEKSEVCALQAECAKVRNEKSEMERKKEECRDYGQKLNETYKELSAMYEKVREQYAAMCAECEERKAREEKLKEELREMQAKRETSEDDEEANAVMMKLAAAEAALARLEGEKKTAQQVEKKTEKERDKVSEELGSTRTKMSALEKALSEEKVKVQRTEEKLARAEAAAISAEKQRESERMRDAEREKAHELKAESKAAKLEAERDALKDELRTLKLKNDENVEVRKDAMSKKNNELEDVEQKLALAETARQIAERDAKSEKEKERAVLQEKHIAENKLKKVEAERDALKAALSSKTSSAKRAEESSQRQNSRLMAEKDALQSKLVALEAQLKKTQEEVRSQRDAEHKKSKTMSANETRQETKTFAAVGAREVNDNRVESAEREAAEMKRALAEESRKHEAVQRQLERIEQECTEKDGEIARLKVALASAAAAAAAESSRQRDDKQERSQKSKATSIAQSEALDDRVRLLEREKSALAAENARERSESERMRGQLTRELGEARREQRALEERLQELARADQRERNDDVPGSDAKGFASSEFASFDASPESSALYSEMLRNKDAKIAELQAQLSSARTENERLCEVQFLDVGSRQSSEMCQSEPAVSSDTANNLDRNVIMSSVTTMPSEDCVASESAVAKGYRRSRSSQVSATPSDRRRSSMSLALVETKLALAEAEEELTRLRSENAALTKAAQTDSTLAKKKSKKKSFF